MVVVSPAGVGSPFRVTDARAGSSFFVAARARGTDSPSGVYASRPRRPAASKCEKAVALRGRCGATAFVDRETCEATFTSWSVLRAGTLLLPATLVLRASGATILAIEARFRHVGHDDTARVRRALTRREGLEIGEEGGHDGFTRRARAL